MSKLSVALGDPQHGWINIAIRSDIQSIRIDASYVYNAFFLVVEALHLLYVTPGERIVTWTCEPTEFDMHFRRDGEVITLEIIQWPDAGRNAFRQDKVFSASGNYTEICLPFWRALRGLQGRFSAAELEHRWEDEFAHRELDALTAVLGKASTS